MLERNSLKSILKSENQSISPFLPSRNTFTQSTNRQSKKTSSILSQTRQSFQTHRRISSNKIPSVNSDIITVEELEL